MELMGIDEKFRQLIMSCVTTTSVSALVEGSPTTIIKTERALRQGDPLPPAICNSYRLSIKVDQAGRAKQVD